MSEAEDTTQLQANQQTPPDHLECQEDNPLGTQYPPLDEFSFVESTFENRDYCPACGEHASLISYVATPDGESSPLLFGLYTCPNEHYWAVRARNRAFGLLLFICGLPLALLLVPLLIGIVAVPYIHVRATEEWTGRAVTGFGMCPWWWGYSVDAEVVK